MIMCFYFLKRKSGMSIEDFHKYWGETHAPIAAKIPGIIKYSLYYPIQSELVKNQKITCDGIAILWFQSEAALKHAMSTHEWKVSAKDNEVFMELPASVMLCEQEVII